MNKDIFQQMGEIVISAKEIANTPVVTKKSTVQIDKDDPEVGWGTARDYLESQKKDVSQWNNNDIRWYFKDCYKKRYGLNLHIPPIKCHTDIEQILFTFYKRLNYEPPKSILKDYIDYYFDRFADADVKLKGSLSFSAMAKGRVVLSFIDYAGLTSIAVRQQPNTKAPDILPVDIFSTASLLDAYRIGPASILMRYGVIVTVNFIVICRGKSQDEAIQYVNKSLSKLSDDDKKTIIWATHKWQPYPTWLQFLDASRFGMTVTLADNQMFDCFKENAEK